VNKATWLADRTASLLPNVLPGIDASAECTYHYWSSCQTGFCISHWLPTLEKRYVYSSCGGVIGWRESGCCY
jgi:hypothetical protein